MDSKNSRFEIIDAIKKLTAFTCCFTLFFAAISQAQTTPPVKFVTEHWPPYNYVDNNGELAGLAVDKVKRAIDTLNWPENIELFHWAKALHQTRVQPNTFIFSIYPTKDRQDEFQWICPLVKTEPVSFYKLTSRTDITLNKKSDAKRFLTGVIRDGVAIETLQSKGFNLKSHLYIASDDDSNLLQLFQNRIDLIVDEQNAVNYRLDKMNKPRNSLTRLLPISNESGGELCLATSNKTDKALVRKLAEVIAELNKGKE